MEVPCVFYGPVNSGFLRAIGGISLGTVAYEISKSIRLLKCKQCNKYLFDFPESIGWFCVFASIVSRVDARGVQDGVVVLIMGVTLGISLSQTTIISTLIKSSKFTSFLGKVSSVLFMNHLYWFNNIRYLLGLSENEREIQTKMIALIMSFISTFAVMILEKPFRMLHSFLKRKCVDGG